MEETTDRSGDRGRSVIGIAGRGASGAAATRTGGAGGETSVGSGYAELAYPGSVVEGFRQA